MLICLGIIVILVHLLLKLWLKINNMQLQVIGKLRPMKADEESYYGDDDILISSQQK